MHRRAFLNTAAVAVAASLPGCMAMAPAVASIRKAAPYVPAPSDAELIAACQEAIIRKRQYNEICEAIDEDDPARDPMLDQCFDAEAGAMEQVIKSSARAQAGLAAKARLLKACFPVAPDGTHHHFASVEERLALSMAADILRHAS